MESGRHTLGELFSQLGLPDDTESIEYFMALHRPLERSVKLCAAPFWNKGQREFLQQAISHDADWSDSVDQLDTRLR